MLVVPGGSRIICTWSRRGVLGWIWNTHILLCRGSIWYFNKHILEDLSDLYDLWSIWSVRFVESLQTTIIGDTVRYQPYWKRRANTRGPVWSVTRHYPHVIFDRTPSVQASIRFNVMVLLIKQLQKWWETPWESTKSRTSTAVPFHPPHAACFLRVSHV